MSFDKPFSRCGLSPNHLNPKILCFIRRPFPTAPSSSIAVWRMAWKSSKEE